MRSTSKVVNSTKSPTLKYTVYCLVKDQEPIYIGMTSNVKNRINTHRRDKEFDHTVIIKEYSNKDEALTAECSIIRYLSIFPAPFNINAKYKSLEFSLIHKSPTNNGNR